MSVNEVYVVSHNVVCMRDEPREHGSLESQAVMGDGVRVLGEAGEYARIETADGYQGWVLRCHLCKAAPEETGAGSLRIVTSLLAPVLREPDRDAERWTLLTAGTEIRAVGSACDGYLQVSMPDGRVGFIEDGRLGGVPARPSAAGVERIALGFVGVPYLWGGTTSFGIDCSGLTQRAYRMCGVLLPRDAYLQAEWEGCEPVDRGSIRAGDLLFFLGDRDPRNRGITHVGMALGGGRMVHASGSPGVVVGRFDDPPYDRQLRCVRRPLAP